MAADSWSIESIDWDRFDRAKVDPDMLLLIKAASLVEYNGGDYAAYLSKVFSDDDGFCAAAKVWAGEEVRHGEALGRWAEMVDPSFDFNFQGQSDGFSIQISGESTDKLAELSDEVMRIFRKIDG